MGSLDFIIFILVIIAVPLIFIAGIVVLIISARSRSGNRTAQMQAVTNQMRWTFTQQVPYTSIPNASYFHLFTQGNWVRVLNVMSGQVEGAQVIVFDITFDSKYVHRTKPHEQTVALFLSNQLSLPAFMLCPSNWKHKLGSMFSNSVNFPSHPAFSGQYLLSGNDVPNIQRVFNDSLLSYCESNPGLSMEGGGEQVFVYREESLVPPQNLAWFVNESLRVFNSFRPSSLPG